MSFKPYPKYKESGVEWLGRVPEHWGVKGLKHFTSLDMGQSPASEDCNMEGHGTPFLQGCAEFGEEHPAPRVFCELPTKIAAAGDMLFSVRAPVGRVNVADQPYGIGRGLCGVRPSAACSPRFLLFSLHQTVAALRAVSTGSTYEAVSVDQLGSVRCPLPPYSEQEIIATFLDHETAKIDALIAEQQRLIELLQEKRQAVISHAVTRGLNPDAPMKDSGIEWLGEVPEHWCLKRLKHVSPFLTVGIVVNPSSYVADEGLPFIYGGDIREGVIDWANSRRISPDSSALQAKTRLRTGDLLMVRVGAPGVTAVVPSECEGGNCASVMLIRQGEFSSDWLCSVLNTRLVRFQVEVVQYGAAQEQFNISHAVNFWIPVPPRLEQDAIAQRLRNANEETDSLIAAADDAIALLQERRSALISAAVTGQIDVRGFAGTEAA